MFISLAQGRQAWAGQGPWRWESRRWPERRPRRTPHCSWAVREEGNRRPFPVSSVGKREDTTCLLQMGARQTTRLGRGRALASLVSGQTLVPEEAGMVPATCRAASCVHRAGQRSVEARTWGSHYIFLGQQSTENQVMRRNGQEVTKEHEKWREASHPASPQGRGQA